MDLRQPLIESVYALKRGLRQRRRARDRKAAEGPLRSPRVVVGMDAGIGNAVEATPLVQALRALWPRADLTLVAPFGDLLADWCVPDRIVSGWDAVSSEPIDVAFLTWASPPPAGLPESVDVHRANRMLPDYLLRPEREVNLDLAREHGWAGDAPPLYVSMRRPDSMPPDARVRIGIAAGGKPDHRWRHKRWPYHAALVDALLERLDGAQVCVFGSEGDDPAELPRRDNVLDLRGKLSLAETAYVMRRCDLVIGNDCGPMHVADATLAPTLVLFGPTCEIKNGPRNRGAVLSVDAPCSPCQYDLELLDACDNPVCMRELGVDAVVERATRLVAD
jgi:ADP-heptose:LPS heptosyltransferase